MITSLSINSVGSSMWMFYTWANRMIGTPCAGYRGSACLIRGTEWDSSNKRTPNSTSQGQLYFQSKTAKTDIT